MNKPRYRAIADLALREASALVLTLGLPAVAAFQLLTLAVNYVIPSIIRRDRVLVQAAQEEFAVLGVTLAIVLGWVLWAPRRRGAVLQRLNQSWQAVLADLLTLLGAVSASIFLYTVIMPGRATLGCGLQGAMETVVSTSPMLALAPALARCRFRPGHLVAFLALMSLSLLGFFGRFSPFRADTVFAATGSVARWLADGMACGACFLISLSFARSRFFETPCG